MVEAIPIIKRKPRIKIKTTVVNNCSICNKSCILRTCVECMVTKESKDPKLYELWMDCQNNFEKWQENKHIKFI